MLGKVLILAWGASWQFAAAAPWVQEDGAWYSRVSFGDESVEGLNGHRMDAYAEYGLTSKLTLTAKYDRIAYSNGSDFNADGWRSNLRYQLLQYGPLHVSLEAGLLQGAAIGGRNGCDKLGGEIGTGIAWSGTWRNRQSFLFGEVMGRFHSDCQRDRIAAGFGQQTSKHVWSITQAWVERGGDNANSNKIQTELVWRTDVADFSVGYRRENGGFFEEESAFLALAKQF